MSDAGSWLQERREELHLSRSGVERPKGESANKAADERYRIRRGRLTDLEAVVWIERLHDVLLAGSRCLDAVGRHRGWIRRSCVQSSTSSLRNRRETERT